jgi:cystathionine beta-synthase
MRQNGFLERARRSVHDLVRAKEPLGYRLLTVAPSTPVRMALSTLSSHGISQLPVIRDGDCVGSVSEGRLMARVIQDPGLLDRPVETVMGSPFPVVDSHLDADKATRLLTRDNPAVLVRSNGKLEDILTRFDVVRTLTGASG